VVKKEAEKILKNKDLIIEIQRMWNVKPKLIPVIIGATGTVSESLRQYLSNVPVKHEIKGLHKTAILCAAHKLREVLRDKYRTHCKGENNITCSTDRKYRTAATLYTVETGFVSGI